MVDMVLSVGRAVTPRRRRRSTEERRLIVEEALEQGASVARVARRHRVNANQVFGWKRLYETGRLGTPASGMTLLPRRALISLQGPVDPAMIRAVLRSLGA
jgi:transposase-like protein